MSLPEQKPGRSKQDYETPRVFLDAVERRFGPLQVDLAARADNAKAPLFVTPEEDSLAVDWVERFGDKHCWLNPPYANIAPWAAKCKDFARRSATGRISFLTPASIGSNWFADFVHHKGYVLNLQGRITFVGESAPYPKDCILTVFGSQMYGNEVWKWGTL